MPVPLLNEATSDLSAGAHARAAKSAEPAWNGSLTAPEVRLHLMRLSADLMNGDSGSGDRQLGLADRVQRGMDACLRLLARRSVLAAAIDTQQRVDRLVHLCEGRMASGEPDGILLAALHERQQAMHDHVTTALGRWWRHAHLFTQLTHLLPTQVAPLASWPARQTLADWQRRIETHVRGQVGVSNETFDAALARCMQAQRVSDSAWPVSVRSMDALAAAEASWRFGRLSAPLLADALLKAFEDRQALIDAEAERSCAFDQLEALTGRVFSGRC